MLRWVLSRLKGDKIIWITVFLISMISMLAVYSSTSALAYRRHDGDLSYGILKHGILLIAGWVVIYAVHLLDYRIFARLTNLLLLVTIGLLLYTIVNGAQINEAARWIRVFGQSFQPSDLAKISLMIYLAKLLTQRQDVIKDFTEGFLPALFWVMIICGLIAPADLSTAALMFLASVLVMFIAGVDGKYLLILTLVALFGLAVLIKTAERSSTWQSRWNDYVERIANPEYKGDYQTIQGNIAIATGGLVGKGVGKSSQRNALPYAYADMIYAIIIEEFGLAGGIVIVGLYLLLLFRTVLIVTVSKTFGALMAGGLAFMLALQAMMNMGVTVGLLPATGLTLPLISMGGTSILITCIMLGIILSVSRESMEKQKKSGMKPQGNFFSGWKTKPVIARA